MLELLATSPAKDSDARFLGQCWRGHGALRAFDKAVRRKPPVVAAEVDPMGIEWGKTAVRSVAEAVRLSTADGSENWLLRKSLVDRAVRKLEEGICFAARRRGAEHAETREGFEFERVVSCGSGEWWRTKLDFCSREPFDDRRRSTTPGAAPEIVRAREVLIGLRLPCCAEQLKTKRQEDGYKGLKLVDVPKPSVSDGKVR